VTRRAGGQRQRHLSGDRARWHRRGRPRRGRAHELLGAPIGQSLIWAQTAAESAASSPTAEAIAAITDGMAFFPLLPAT
jgi:hypothetical protein